VTETISAAPAGVLAQIERDIAEAEREVERLEAAQARLTELRKAKETLQALPVVLDTLDRFLQRRDEPAAAPPPPQAEAPAIAETAPKPPARQRIFPRTSARKKPAPPQTAPASLSGMPMPEGVVRILEEVKTPLEAKEIIGVAVRRGLLPRNPSDRQKQGVYQALHVLAKRGEVEHRGIGSPYALRAKAMHA
jgi:hypothetical protein